MGLWKKLTGAVGVLAAIFSFAASNSPDEVATRTTGWLALPIIRDIPSAVVSFAAHPIVLAASFFGVGVWAGLWIAKFAIRTSKADPMRSLGGEMSDMAFRVEAMSAFSHEPSVIGDLDALMTKIRAAGFAAPTGRMLSRDRMALYLHSVSAFLRSGQVADARACAIHRTKEYHAGRVTDAASGGLPY